MQHKQLANLVGRGEGGIASQIRVLCEELVESDAKTELELVATGSAFTAPGLCGGSKLGRGSRRGKQHTQATTRQCEVL